MTEASREWRPRFRLANLVWLTLCIGMGFAAYRFGYIQGQCDRTNVGDMLAQIHDVKDVARKYRTPDSSETDWIALMNDVEAHVLPNTWVDGGPARMAPLSPTQLLVVHDRDGQTRVAEYLKYHGGSGKYGASNDWGDR